MTPVTSPSSRRSHNDSGATAVEFALIAPVLFLIVFGIIGFGIVFGQTLALNNASRDAARFAVVRQIDGSDARTCLDTVARARAAATSIGMRSNQVAVTVALGPTTVCSLAAGQPLPATATGAFAKAPCKGSLSGVNDQLQVTTTYASSVPVPVVSGPTINLTGRSYFRCEYS